MAVPFFLRNNGNESYDFVVELGAKTVKVLNDNTDKIIANATANKDEIVAALVALDKRAQQMLALMNDPVNITKTLPASLIETQTAKATAVVTLRDDTQVSSEDKPADFEWHSSDESVISVDADGTLHALKAGMASISVIYLHQLESEGANVNVEAKKVTSVAILSTTGAAPTTSVLVGGNVQLRAQATYNTGDKGNLLGSSATWASSNAKVATVNVGTVAGVAVGTTNITATVEGVTSPALAFTVNPIAVTGITMPATASVLVGGTTSVAATVAPANATNKTVTYASDKTTIATVDNTGLVTGKAVGTAVITGTSADGAKAAKTTVTVNPVPVASVAVAPATASVEVKKTVTLAATVKPDNATNKAVTWSTSDATKATVANGVVTGVAAGTATITATSSADATKKASATVTVTAVTPPAGS